ncbi:hypothetical protein [Mycetocola lacteus]|uniref:hypothetical protein n=1 Tax=Mycetocola lacteus TaxID=76637 RepID=UPI0011C3DA5D|nr:hypothetical protein [Mycetocola lacteus]
MNYSTLSATIGQLKQASIDAYMRGKGWRMAGDQYVLSAGTTSLSATRPNSSGSGGGRVTGLIPQAQAEEFAAAFADISDEIDALLYPWESLPDPDGIEEVLESCRRTTQRLSGASSVSNGELMAAGNIASYLKLIDQNTIALSGITIATFKAKFLAQLGVTAGGLHAISLARGANIAAQKGIWTRARKNVVEIVSNARDAMTAISSGKSGLAETTLQVAGWAGKGLSIFASGGVSVALEVVNLGISILSETDQKRVEASYKAISFD